MLAEVPALAFSDILSPLTESRQGFRVSTKGKIIYILLSEKLWAEGLNAPERFVCGASKTIL